MSRHLGSLASDYVDRRLHPSRLAQLDRHVMTCPGCRAKADEERALLSAMRTGPPSVSAGLRETLLGLAADAPTQPQPSVPAVPEAPASMRAARLPVVAPAAPALHRSPFRATVLAGLAASASAAVAWGLATPAGPSGSAPTVPIPVPATVVREAAPPVSVVSFTGAQASLGRPPVLTERLGR